MVNNRPSSLESPGSGREVSELRVRSGTIRFNRMEVSAGTDSTEHDQFATIPSSYVSTQQGSYKAHEVSLNVDLESGAAK
jgi:hypothetical protein